jgi:hypothetical protein
MSLLKGAAGERMAGSVRHRKSNRMTAYRRIDGDPGVIAYQFGYESILVAFQNGRRFLYTYYNVGSRTVEAMKHLAVKGQGLDDFIYTYLRDAAVPRLR